MRQTAHDRLASVFDSHEPVRQLHDVPPHEVWEVSVDGRRAVYKGNTGPTGRAATEGHVTAFVGARTSVPVPTVLHVGSDFYVAAWHPDAPTTDAEPETTDAWSRAAGRTLATLHAESAPAVDGYGDPRPAEAGLVVPHNDWHAAATAYVRDRRSLFAEHGHEDLADAVLDLLADRPDAFGGAGASACCHGWWTVEHVAVAGGEVRCVVDFEHALAAPVEFDYWRTVLPAFLARDDETGLEAFRDGYESVRSLPEGMDRRKPWFLLLCETYYVESLYVQDQHGPDETARRAARLRERLLDRVEAL